MAIASQTSSASQQDATLATKMESAVLWAAATVLILLAFMVVFDYFIFYRWMQLHSEPLSFVEWNSNWTPFATIGYFVTWAVMLMLFASHYNRRDPVRTKRWIAILGYCACVELFALIGASGGLLASPFSTFFAAILSAAALIGRKSKRILQLLVVMITEVILLYIIQICGGIPEVRSTLDSNSGSFFGLYYMLCAIGTLVVTYLADKKMGE